MENYEEEQISKYEKFSNMANYLIIGLISLIATCFIPMLGSELGLGFNLPDSAAGWIVWASTRLISATMNVLIYHCFVSQGKVNSKNHPNFIEANNILMKVTKDKKWMPVSPKKFLAKQYLSKGTSIFISTILSIIGLSSALLQFDLVLFLAMVFSTLITCVFGYIEMKKVEEYWQNEYLSYAKLKKEEQDEKQVSEETQKEVKSVCLISEIENSETSKNKSLKTNVTSKTLKQTDSMD